jgi:hypothetical protein
VAFSAIIPGLVPARRDDRRSSIGSPRRLATRPIPVYGSGHPFRGLGGHPAAQLTEWTPRGQRVVSISLAFPPDPAGACRQPSHWVAHLPPRRRRQFDASS